MNAGTGSAVRRRAWRRGLPRLVLLFADRERQQLIAHRLGGLVALVDQLRRCAASRAIRTRSAAR